MALFPLDAETYLNEFEIQLDIHPKTITAVWNPYYADANQSF